MPAETHDYYFSPTNESCLPAPSVIKPKERELIHCRFRSINAHAEQESSEFSRIGNRKGL